MLATNAKIKRTTSFSKLRRWNVLNVIRNLLPPPKIGLVFSTFSYGKCSTISRFTSTVQSLTFPSRDRVVEIDNMLNFRLFEWNWAAFWGRKQLSITVHCFVSFCPNNLAKLIKDRTTILFAGWTLHVWRCWTCAETFMCRVYYNESWVCRKNWTAWQSQGKTDHQAK